MRGTRHVPGQPLLQLPVLAFGVHEMMSHGLLLEWIRATLDPVHQCNACPHDHLTGPDLSNGLSADAFFSMDSWLLSESGALSLDHRPAGLPALVELG